MSSTMDKLKDKLHIRRKSQSEDSNLTQAQAHAHEGTHNAKSAQSTLLYHQIDKEPLPKHGRGQREIAPIHDL